MQIRKIGQFNIIIVGTGGQGLVTLLQIIAEAASAENYDVKTSELHGLSQRGGSVEVHARFGEKIYSPLVSQGRADLILGLEMQECLGAAKFASSKTTFLINKYLIPIPQQKPIPEEKIIENLKKITKNINLIPATDICQKELQNPVAAGVYLLSLASFQKILPLKPASIGGAIKKIIPQKYLELNLKTLDLAKNKTKMKIK